MQSLLRYNTFGIDAKCRQVLVYHTIEELQHYIADGVFRTQRVLHIGGGSNLLFTQEYYDMIVLHSAIYGKQVLDETAEDVHLRVGAAEVWDDFVSWTIGRGYYGLANLSLIPGEVGASAVQNIGAYGAEVSQYIERVHVVDMQTGEISSLTHDECQYAYRDSVFKHKLQGRYAVVYVDFRLARSFTPIVTHNAIQQVLQGVEPLTAARLREAVIAVRQAKLPDPKDIGSAGSFFKNPVVENALAEQLLRSHPDMPHFCVADGTKIPAGWLIEQCGWKGKRLGNVGVYPKQALVIVNYGGAKGKDIVAISHHIQADVQRQFGVTLEPEVNFI